MELWVSYTVGLYVNVNYLLYVCSMSVCVHVCTRMCVCIHAWVCMHVGSTSYIITF